MASKKGTIAIHAIADCQGESGDAIGKITICSRADARVRHKSFNGIFFTRGVYHLKAVCPGQGRSTIFLVLLDVFIRALSHVLVPLFLIGMVGSSIVVLITFIHDVRDFFTSDEEAPSAQDGL